MLLIGGAYLFQSFDGMNSIKNVDNNIVKDISKVLSDNLTDNKADNIADNSSDNMSVKIPHNLSVIDNVSGIQKDKESVEKSVESFFNVDSIKEGIKNNLGKLSGIFEKNGLSLDAIKDNENIKSFLGTMKNGEGLSLDNDTMQKLLSNESMKKIFNSEGLDFDAKSVEGILNSPAVKEFFKTGKTSDIDNKTLQSLLDNGSIQELLMSAGEENPSKIGK